MQLSLDHFSPSFLGQNYLRCDSSSRGSSSSNCQIFKPFSFQPVCRSAMSGDQEWTEILQVMLKCLQTFQNSLELKQKVGNPILHPTNLTELRDVAAAELPG